METEKLATIKELIDTAERSLKSARGLLSEMVGDTSPVRKQVDTQSLSQTEVGGEKIIEGVFDGEKMLGPDGRAYPVPHNYASKSKLIPGDLLKLTIAADGRFIYKNIGPIERTHIIGTLTYEEGSYRVIAQGKVYRVLTASVTFFKAEPGDQLSIIVPMHHESSWAAVEALLSPAEAAAQEAAQAAAAVPEDTPEAAPADTEEAPAEPKPAAKSKTTKKKEPDPTPDESSPDYQAEEA